ncbi:MAG: mechanosensitive ion channel [Desulfobacterales bacterium]|nr:MAG: mechanosensitive ion channel [Desulfobacterales bacterium]
MEDTVTKIWGLLTLYGLRVVAAIVVLLLGRWIAKGLTKVIEKVLNKKEVDATIISFVKSLTYIALLVFVVLAALGQLGIQTTSFIAVIGAAGLAIGLALQGSLSNFAAGFLMIIFRPFKVGDYIEGAGVAGTVEAIQIFTTQLKTPDNKTGIVPNAKITGDNITNYTMKGTRRVDMVFGIGYGDDIDTAKSILEDLVANDNRILDDPPVKIAVVELADSSVNFVVRPWVKSDDYWDVYFELTENVKKRFDAEGVSIPFPQQDVHVYQHKEE